MTSDVRQGFPVVSYQSSSSGRMRYSVRQSVRSFRSRDSTRSTPYSAAGERGRKSSQRRPSWVISASAKRVVRISCGNPSAPHTARASVSVRNERSGVSSARVKVCSVAVMAYSVLTLMEPMLSMATSSSAEAL